MYEYFLQHGMGGLEIHDKRIKINGIAELGNDVYLDKIKATKVLVCFLAPSHCCFSMIFFRY